MTESARENFVRILEEWRDQRGGAYTLVKGEPSCTLYFDVLGFHQLLSDDPAALYEKYSQAIGLLAAITAVHADPTQGYTQLIDVDVFSDSGFIFFRGNDAVSWMQCCNFANNAFRSFLSRGMVISGAVARGSLWYDRGLRIRLGSAITNAYAIADDKDYGVDCVGIVASPDETGEALSEELIEAPTKKNGPRKFRVPIRRGYNGLPQVSADCGPGWNEAYKRAGAAGARPKAKLDDGKALVDRMLR